MNDENQNTIASIPGESIRLKSAQPSFAEEVFLLLLSKTERWLDYEVFTDCARLTVEAVRAFKQEMAEAGLDTDD